MLAPGDLDLIRHLVREEIRAALVEQAAPAPAPGWLTVAQVAERAGVHPQTVRQWIKEGALAAARRGRLVRVKAADLDAYLAAESATEATVIDIRRAVREWRSK